MEYNSRIYIEEASRELGIKDINKLTKEALKEYYTSENYETYFIEYIGNITDALEKLDYADIFLTGKFFAILFVKKGMLNSVVENVPQIINVEKNFPYTLSELTVSSDVYNYSRINKGTMTLLGEGVIVGIIGTGIDYLNPRFITAAGESRIIAIWDQTIDKGKVPEFFPYGTEYKKSNINEAIMAKSIGKYPYEFVEHKDKSGIGTAIAGIIGGGKISPSDPLISVAPRCEFAIVKLQEARADTLELAGIVKGTKNVYQATNISSAIGYLSELQATLKKPMVVYLPLGTNFGGRDGDTVLERYIDNLTQRRDFSIVTNTGDQGMGETHTSGIIKATGDTNNIYINVDINQSSLSLSIYTHRPDIISISITSPTGQKISKIPIPSIKEQNKYLLLEENGINIEYFAQEKLTGDVSVDMLIKNITGGIWIISVYGEYILNGKYDAWIPQKELVQPETRFLEPDPYTTLLTPSTAINSLVTSYYNQERNTIALKSGRGFPRVGIIEPAVTIGAINLLTVGTNNSLIVTNGAAMAGGILAGAVALIYEWALVSGESLNIYPPRIKNYLIAATIKDDTKIYPNEEWGYGKFNFSKLNEVLYKSLVRNINSKDYNTEPGEAELMRGLYIHIPIELYEKVKNTETQHKFNIDQYKS